MIKGSRRAVCDLPCKRRQAGLLLEGITLLEGVSDGPSTLLTLMIERD